MNFFMLHSKKLYIKAIQNHFLALYALEGGGKLEYKNLNWINLKKMLIFTSERQWDTFRMAKPNYSFVF